MKQTARTILIISAFLVGQIAILISASMLHMQTKREGVFASTGTDTRGYVQTIDRANGIFILSREPLAPLAIHFTPATPVFRVLYTLRDGAIYGRQSIRGTSDDIQQGATISLSYISNHWELDAVRISVPDKIPGEASSDE